MNSADIDAIKRIESRDFFAHLAPSLAIGERTRFNGIYDSAESSSPSAQDRVRFESDGWFSLESAIPQAEVAAMRDAILALEAAGVPALFAYVYDAFWQTLCAIAPPIAHLIGPLQPLPDFWAWHLPVGTSASGWRPHRGSYTLERVGDGKPAAVNVWIALTDVDERNACMWVVPQSQDADYPNALDSHAAVTHGVPIALTAGSVMGWDANVLHWGGDMTPSAACPRISFSFTLRAVGAPNIDSPQFPETLDFSARLQLIAEMIAVYRHQAAPMPFYTQQWAKMRRALVSATLSRSRRSA